MKNNTIDLNVAAYLDRFEVKVYDKYGKHIDTIKAYSLTAAERVWKAAVKKFGEYSAPTVWALVDGERFRVLGF